MHDAQLSLTLCTPHFCPTAACVARRLLHCAASFLPCVAQVLYCWGRLGKLKMKQDGANEEAWVTGLATLVGCGALLASFAFETVPARWSHARCAVRLLSVCAFAPCPAPLLTLLLPAPPCRRCAVLCLLGPPPRIVVVSASLPRPPAQLL